MGPLAAGEMISCSVWIKTIASQEMILVFYGDAWGLASSKNLFLLTLKDGNPLLYIRHDKFLIPRQSLSLNDGNWTNIVVSMPTASCLLSEVKVFVNDEEIDVDVDGTDDHIFYTTAGYLSVGGLGFSNEAFGGEVFTSMKNYKGSLKEFQLWYGNNLEQQQQWQQQPIQPIQEVSVDSERIDDETSPTSTTTASAKNLTIIIIASLSALLVAGVLISSIRTHLVRRRVR